jgi:hypothetical protein
MILTLPEERLRGLPAHPGHDQVADEFDPELTLHAVSEST